MRSMVRGSWRSVASSSRHGNEGKGKGKIDTDGCRCQETVLLLWRRELETLQEMAQR